jgi:hypothetical protein
MNTGITTEGFTSSAGSEVSDSSSSGGWEPECLPTLRNVDLGSDGECDGVDGQFGRSECTTWLDLCPAGMKCYDVDDSPSGGHCGSIVDPVVPPYGACVVDVQTETDDCDRSYSCEVGICQPRATCSKESPHCEDPGSAWGGYSNICAPACSLLDPECPPGLRCYWSIVGGLCGPASEGQGDIAVGDSCDHHFDCAEFGELGALCYGDRHLPDAPPLQYDASRIPGCAAVQCCAEICALPNGVCSDPAAVCTTIGIDAATSACADGAGVCLLPE